MARTVRTALAVTMGLAAAAWAGEGTNPYQGRQEAEKVYEFAAKPTVAKKGNGYLISFASKAACDATVAVVLPGAGPRGVGDKVIRHLASGVLGKNAPWPFKQGTLAQEIEWDGKDDAGQPAPAGCRVRVGLGLEARLDRILGWAPGLGMGIMGLAVGPGGDVFVLSGGMENQGGHSIVPNVRVFDRDGQYLRRILPPEASVSPERATIMDWARTAWGTDVPVRRMSYIMNAITRDVRWAAIVQGQTPVVTADGKFVFVTATLKDKVRRAIMVDVRDGATPAGSIVEIGETGEGDEHLALSPDGKWLYLGGSAGTYEPKRATHAVYRVSMEKPGKAEVFAGEAGAAGNADGRFNRPLGVACDAQGRVYVADSGNGRLQVFSPDGKHLKNIEVKGVRRVAVSGKSGEILVVAGEGRTSRLDLLGGFENPAVKTSCPLKFVPAGMAVDAGGASPIVWLAENRYRASSLLHRIEVKDGRLAEVPYAFAPPEKGWDNWRPWSPSAYLAVDPRREELYVREAGMCGPSRLLRVNGRTGAVIEAFGVEDDRETKDLSSWGVDQVAAAPDGKIWMRLALGGRWIVCYDPDKGQFVSLPEGKPVEKAAHKGVPLTGIFAPANGGARAFPDMMAVAPNGDVYVPCGIRPEDEAELKAAGFAPPEKKSRMYEGVSFGNLLRVYSPDGKLKTMNALPGLGGSNGIRIGRRGEVYAALACQPVKGSAPEGLAAGTKWDPTIWGSLVKFDSAFGKFPVGVLAGRWEGKPPADATHRCSFSGPAKVENALWDYPGVSPLPMGGGMACCTCWKSTFDLDRFERSFVPAAHTCTVNVLDANGNVIARLGGYGNADSRGTDSPVLDPKTGAYRPHRPDDPKDWKSPLEKPELGFLDPRFVGVTDEAVYVSDSGNERIVRAALGYRQTETVIVP